MKNLSANRQHKLQWIIEMSVLIAVFAIFAWAAVNGVKSQSSVLFDEGAKLEKTLVYISICSGIIPVFYLIFQSILVCFYKPVTQEVIDDSELPGCSIIVPAYTQPEHAALVTADVSQVKYVVV